MPLLSLSRVCFDYGREKLLRDVTLDVEPGEKVALAGMNGSGKSTLLRLIEGTLLPDAGERHIQRRARVVSLPQETAAEGEGTLLRWVGGARSDLDAVRTELGALQARLERGEELDAETLHAYGDLQHRFETLGGYEHESTVEAALHGLGFTNEDFEKPVRVLSGGERRRAALAAVLVQGGDLLLLDEPTNHLDLDALEWLQGFVNQSPSAMLIVSHDRYFLDHTVSSVWHLSRSTLMRWSGNYSKFVRDYESWVSQEEAAYNRQQHEIRKTEDFIRRNIAGQKTKQAQSRRKRLDKLDRLEKPREERSRFKLRLRTAKRGGNVVLRARGLTQRFGERTLFADLDLDITRGNKVGIIGPNGSGKTTLLQILAGRTAPDVGSIKLGSEIDLGYFDQELDFVGDAPALTEEIWRVDQSLREEDVRTLLGAFGFGEDFADRPVRALSGGQRSRLGLLKLVMMRHNFLVLDEPTNHLDLDSVELLEEGLRHFEGTLLLVSHDRLLLSRAVDTLLVLTAGRARLFHGGYEEYIESLHGRPLWSEIAAFESERRRQQERREPQTATLPPAEDAGRRSDGGSPPRAAPVSKNALARLRKNLDATEDGIVSLEVDLEEIEAALAKSAGLEAHEIASLSRQHAAKKKELEARYESWNTLTEQVETMSHALQEQGRRKRKR
ncbi:MAG: ABC-F family ATP-binding cassette domain-containing protein [Candidatus Latescibacterota bacterium]|nr:MAG: ABC-F family ATP-binding cassette domain-containing protein [Candidatus Latescibacterota bacterium]